MNYDHQGGSEPVRNLKVRFPPTFDTTDTITSGRGIVHESRALGSDQKKQRSYSTMEANEQSHDRSSSLPAQEVSLQSSSAGPESFFTPRDPHYHNEHQSQRPRLVLPPMRHLLPPVHYPGDGLDFRRPVMSVMTQEREDNVGAGHVIDLTREDSGQGPLISDQQRSEARPPRAQRLPRYDRNIIDLISDGNESGQNIYSAQNTTPSESRSRRSSPTRNGRAVRDLEQADGLPSSIELLNPLTYDATTNGHSATSTYTPLYESNTIDLTEDDDVVITSSRRREHGINVDRPEATAGAGTRRAADDEYGRVLGLFNTIPGIPRLRSRMFGSEYDGPTRQRFFRANVTPYFQQRIPPPDVVFGGPHFLDFQMVGFDMGLPGGTRPATPKYEPPSSAPEGFTRNPGEDEEVVCPNCGDELAMGEDEEKREVWVIKGCGHAYCGECSRHRTRSVNRKGKDRTDGAWKPPPFKECVVEGCDKSASAKSMVLVYLGG